MKCVMTPCEVSDLVPFSPALNSSYISRSPKSAFAGVTKNGLWIWVVRDTTINLYHTENSEWFGGYSFGESLKNPSAKITSVTEFCSSFISFPCLLIAVNHDDETLICIYDINSSKVIRSVLVPDTVLKMEVISSNGGACMDTHHLFIQLRYLFGIVALGTSKGLLYFLDLCLDEHFICDEHLPNITFMLNKYELLPERREKAIAKQQHVFMLLNDQSAHNDAFEVECRSSPLSHFSFGKEAHITALKYFQSTVTLALGFNFGGIQLWDLSDLCLLYTVANQAHEVPIVAFAFQEPENDPRNFCYLWIIRGYAANKKPEDFSIAAMYSLIYSKRTYIESYGNLYTELQSCCKRFEYPLTSDPFASSQSSSLIGSSILSCQTVCQTDEYHMDAASANDSDTASENMSLCFLSWVVWNNSGSSSTSYHMALFDLNQWYQAQMPFSSFKSDPSHLNPYFAHFSLEEVVQNFDLEPILGLYAIPHSIKKFKYTSPTEEFFYPSSLDFQTLVFSNNGICKATFLGVQKSLLYEIGDMGPNALSNPKELFTDLIRYGLVSNSHGNSDRVPLIMQRETILQLFLEYHMPFFFMKCMKEWRYADSIQEGCSSRALLNWAWKKVFNIKNSIDKLNLPLFNCSGSDVDSASLKCLYGYRRQLDLIDSILMGFQKFAAPRTEQGIQELKCRKNVVFSINMYLQVVLWLRSVQVLPEVCEGEETERNIFYPVNALVSSYVRRRNSLQNIHSSIGATDILLIDGLVKEAFGENTWHEKGGNGIYPPPSIYAALSCYLIDGIDLDLKHSLMYYLLLDICNTPHNAAHPRISDLKKFPLVFDMPQSISQLVKAFWCLDQFKFEAAIKRLFHPAVKTSDILPWQHHRVIKSFLFQKEPQKALKYINHMDPPENSIEDMKLHMSVLLSKGAITQALHYQRSKQPVGFGRELLHHLLLGCQETHRLKDLMYLPLNPLESSALVKFLSENDDPCAQEALVMYHLLRCNIFEAAKINEKLSMSRSGKFIPTHDRKDTRDALVEGFLASVPKTEKNLVEEINRFPSLPVKKGDSIHPLTFSVKNAPVKQISYSDILTSLISDASSAMCTPYLEPQTPLKSATQSFFSNIPFLRQPLTPEFTRLSTETIHSTPVAKRLLVSPTSEFSSPSKKSRLLDNATFKTSSISKKKIPMHLAGDVASLLQSPPIHRRSSKVSREGSIRDSPTVPPQGILKKKTEPFKTPLSDLYTSRTPSLLSEDEDSVEDFECEKMAVGEEESDDIPGRQIRFSVPSKEELNTSVTSISDAESSMFSLKGEYAGSNISNEPSNFMKKLNQLKSLPTLDPFSSGDQKFLNVSRRTSLLNLTREPLKCHSKQSSADARSLVSDSSTLASENPVESAMVVENSDSSSSVSSQSSSQFKGPTKHEVTVEFSDSDSSHSIEIIDIITASQKPVEESKSAPAESSSGVLSSALPPNLDPESGWRPILHLSSTESDHNKSGSSSGNSSYNSASDRSLSVTPRRPLRDNNRSASNSDLSCAVEDKIDDTLIGSDIEKCDYADIALVGEVPALPFEEIESVEKKEANINEYDISQDIPLTSRVTVQSVKDLIDEQIERSLAKDCKEELSSVPSNVTLVKCVEEVTDIEALDSASESEKDDVCVQNEYLFQTVQNKNQDIFTCPEENDFAANIVATIEFPTESSSSVQELDSSSSVQELNPASDLTVYDFTEDIPTPSLPAYVPIKERIGKSYTSFSESVRVDDVEDISSSYLSKEKMDQPVQESVFQAEKSDLEELKYATKSSPEYYKSESESCDAMETDEPKRELSLKDRAALASSTSPSTSSIGLSQKLSDRFDFMSRNSEFYENNRLYRKAMHLLKESDIPHNNELFSEKMTSSRKTRTFVFAKHKSESVSKIEEEASKSEDSNSRTGDETAKKMKEFLESFNPESYEQFSHSIQRGNSDDGQTMNLKSSPSADHEKSSSSIFDASSVTEEPISENRRNRKHGSMKKDTSVIRKAKSSVKKAKDKMAKKMQFSFADPHSPAGPEVLEALNKTPDYQIGSFMFSPPLTRGRLRQKRLDDTLGSSFASVTSETSFAQSKKPPVDPILEGIMAERSAEPRMLTDSTVKSKTTKSSTKKKSPVKKTKDDLPHFENVDLSLNASNLEAEDAHKVLSSARYSMKHKMVLRKGKVKPRTEQLF